MTWHAVVGERWRGYWRAPLDPFWVRFEQRLLIWLTYTLAAGVMTFVALQLRYGNSTAPQFRGMYAWHTAVNFGLCLLVADLALDGFCRWRRLPRTVAATWLAGWGAWLVGFALQRTVVYQAIKGYYPYLLLMYQNNVLPRPTALRMFLYCTPFWLLVYVLLVWLLLRLQSRALAVVPPAPHAPHPREADNLTVPTDRGLARLPVNAITHISMEDHYAHIHLQEEGAARRLLVRMTLQQAQERLPAGRFVQIHRSHLINLQHLRELRKDGRSWEALIGSEKQPLPVSRQRLGELRAYLDRQG